MATNTSGGGTSDVVDGFLNEWVDNDDSSEHKDAYAGTNYNYARIQQANKTKQQQHPEGSSDSDSDGEEDGDDFNDLLLNRSNNNKKKNFPKKRKKHNKKRSTTTTQIPVADSNSSDDDGSTQLDDYDLSIRSAPARAAAAPSVGFRIPPPQQQQSQRRPPRILDLIQRLNNVEEQLQQEKDAREALEDMIMPLLVYSDQNQLITRSEVQDMIQQAKEEVLVETQQQQQQQQQQAVTWADQQQQKLQQSWTPEGPLGPVAEEAPPVRQSAAISAIFDQQELNNLVDHRLSVKQAEEEDWHAPFGESVYTLLYMFPIQSQSFWYSIFVYMVQMGTISLTLADIVDDYIPHMVSPAVTWGQAVTILLLLASQSDLTEAVIKLQDGFYPEVLEVHLGATYGTWLISCILQLCAGILLLITSLILTLQAENVLNLMLNLTALLFMAEIDDLGFAMGKNGFITDRIQKEAESVADFKVPKRKRCNTHRRILYTLVLVGLYIGYITFKREQVRGDNLPTYIYVQFGDAYNPRIPYYSGILASSDSTTMSHRRYRDIGTENILLGYCKSEKAWTFSERDDSCDYFARSFETETYDVALIPDSDWQVVDEINRLQPFDSFSLVSRDCDPKTCQGECGDNGLCVCPYYLFGIDCEFSNVCKKLAVDERFKSFPPVKQSSFSHELTGAFAVSDEFEILRNPATKEYVSVYNMPVYYSNKTYPANIMFFGGRRWILTSEWDLFDMNKAKEEHPDRWFFPEKTVATLEDQFHGYHQASYTPFFISDPVDFETPDFQPTPVGLKWWTAQEDKDAPRHYAPDIALDTIISCDRPPPSCVEEPEGFCGTGTCDEETGYCKCKQGLEYYGDRCELLKPCFTQIFPCGGNGKCDVFSGTCDCNLPYYGDLCEEHFKCYEEGGSCRNGGQCDFISGHCDCPKDPAVSGFACEKVNDCHVFGCENGGICGPNGSCICPPPFKGKHCHLADASQKELVCSGDDDCENGSCDMETGVCNCKDPTAFGARCEHNYNCSSQFDWVGPKCQNNGNCTESGVCECPEPYFGHDCSKVRACSDDGDCGYGEFGTCNTTTGNCECAFSLVQGKRCDQPFSCQNPIAERPCLNGGTCNILGACRCVIGYSGFLCEQFVAGMYDPRYDVFQRLVTNNITACGFSDPYCNMTDSDVFSEIIAMGLSG